MFSLSSLFFPRTASHSTLLHIYAPLIFFLPSESEALQPCPGFSLERQGDEGGESGVRRRVPLFRGDSERC